MTWILTMVLRSPLWMKVAGVSLIVLGVMEVLHRREVARLDKQIATLTQEVGAEQKARVDLEGSQARVQADRDAKVLDILRQNEAIAAVTVRAERAEAQAALRATRIVQQGQQLAEALRRDTGPVRVPSGYEGLNDWMKGRLP